MSAGERVRLVTDDWTVLCADASAIRTTVFVEEQGIPASLEWDPADASALHCVAYLDDRPIATGRLLPDGHIGRMAVLAPDRGGGVGARILMRLVDEAAYRGHREAVLSAQAQVVGFYARYGFVAVGEPYDEVGIRHQAMRRRLEDRSVHGPAGADGADDRCG